MVSAPASIRVRAAIAGWTLSRRAANRGDLAAAPAVLPSGCDRRQIRGVSVRPEPSMRPQQGHETHAQGARRGARGAAEAAGRCGEMRGDAGPQSAARGGASASSSCSTGVKMCHEASSSSALTKCEWSAASTCHGRCWAARGGAGLPGAVLGCQGRGARGVRGEGRPQAVVAHRLRAACVGRTWTSRASPCASAAPRSAGPAPCSAPGRPRGWG